MGLSQRPIATKPPSWADTFSATSQMQTYLPLSHAMPRPSSMLFDLEMEEPPSTPQLDTEAQQAVVAVQRLVSRLMAACCEVVADVEAACHLVVAHGKNISSSALAEALSHLGYSVAIRESLGGGSGGPKNQVQQPRGSSGGAVIVDPTFKDQFDIAHKTLRYAAILNALPAVLVCHSSRIQALVELLCGEMSLAFHSTDTVLPPWRYTKSMLSKWQPRQSVDLSLAPVRTPTTAAMQQPPAVSQALAPTSSQAIVQSSRLLNDAGAVSEISGSGSSSSTCFLAAGRSHPGSSRESCRTTISNSAATPGQYPMTGQSSSSGNQPLLAAHQQEQNQQDVQQVMEQAGACLFPLSRCAVSATGAPLTHTASESLLARRQMSFEPLRRIVGGFAASSWRRGT